MIASQTSQVRLWLQLRLLNLAVDTIGEEASRSASGTKVDNLQDLGRCAGEGDSVAICGGQDVVPSLSVVDTLIRVVLGAIQHVTASRDGVDNGGDIDAIGCHDIAILNQSGADVASVVRLNCQDACKQVSAELAIRYRGEKGSSSG